MKKEWIETWKEQRDKVSVIISTWNRLDCLKDTIKSVCEQDYKNIFLYIVDNCSNDGTIQYLNDLCLPFDDWDFKIMPNSNFSAMQTLNIGFDKARKENCDYILVLDDDVILNDTSTISKMLQVIKSGNNIGMVACNIITPEENLPQLEFKFPFTSHIDIRNLPEKPFRVFDFVGACALFNIDIFKKYDETFGIYWNEADTCLNMLCRGFEVLYMPDVSVIHLISQKQRLVKRGVYYYIRNGNIIINRYLSFKNRLFIVPLRSIILLLQGLIYFKDPLFTLKCMDSCIVAFKDIFYMRSRMSAINNRIRDEINQSYTSFYFRKFYEWIFKYPSIEIGNR